MGAEKKAGYGANEASFTIEYAKATNEIVFCTLNRQKGPGQYHPVYKTESLPAPHMYEVRIDTDSLCNGHMD
jgi:hypothetical protein